MWSSVGIVEVEIYEGLRLGKSGMEVILPLYLMVLKNELEKVNEG